MHDIRLFRNFVSKEDTFEEREVISENLEKHMRMNKKTGKKRG
jgi:hypothetical protein